MKKGDILHCIKYNCYYKQRDSIRVEINVGDKWIVEEPGERMIHIKDINSNNCLMLHHSSLYDLFETYIEHRKRLIKEFIIENL